MKTAGYHICGYPRISSFRLLKSNYVIISVSLMKGVGSMKNEFQYNEYITIIKEDSLLRYAGIESYIKDLHR